VSTGCVERRLCERRACVLEGRRVATLKSI
jgi:hypothetical protein